MSRRELEKSNTNKMRHYNCSAFTWNNFFENIVKLLYNYLTDYNIIVIFLINTNSTEGR